MMRDLPPLSAVQVFESAARHENFTAAAAELGMTQAAVSYQVKALEDRVSAALFVRDKGRVKLTPLGAVLLPQLTQAFDQIEAAFKARRSDDEATLTISTTYTFANSWLAWRLGAFQVEHPGLAVRLETSNAVVDLRSGEADLAVRAGYGGWPGMIEQKLFVSDFTPMIAPERLASIEHQLGRALEPADLLDFPRINPSDDWWQQWFADCQVETDAGKLGRPGLRMENQANEGHAAMGGQGFSLLTPLLWHGDVAAGRLVAPFPDRVSSRGWAYWLVYPEERRKQAKIRQFRDWLVEEIGRALAEEGQEAAQVAAQLSRGAGD